MSERDFVIPRENLPDGFAENIEHPPEEPAIPRPAATIVLLRDGEPGLELLLMRRSRRAGFVPGAWVFPGGRVDRADADNAVLERLDDLDAEAAERRLELRGADPPALAYYLAALREAFEETGILVGTGDDGAAPPTAVEDDRTDAVRNELMADHISFGEAAARLGARIAGGAVEYIAHWITPEAEPRRYDTRFFAARVDPRAEPIIDPREMTDAQWITPTDALDRLDRGELPMVFPTIKTIEQLAAHPSAEAALEAWADAPVRTILPRLVLTPTGVGLEVGGDGGA